MIDERKLADGLHEAAASCETWRAALLMLAGWIESKEPAPARPDVVREALEAAWNYIGPQKPTREGVDAINAIRAALAALDQPAGEEVLGYALLNTSDTHLYAEVHKDLPAAQKMSDTFWDGAPARRIVKLVAVEPQP
jgi:hypothetical protein